jgi:hypothetical protein
MAGRDRNCQTRLMKTITCLLLLLIAVNITGQQPTSPRPPIGAPANAKFFHGKWYAVVLDKLDWHRAKTKCEERAGQLAVIHDEPTWAFIKSLTKASVWLGATDEKIEGEWVWVDGRPMTFTAWDAKQPDNVRNNQHYLVMWRGSVWQDIGKKWDAYTPMPTVGYICEWKSK